MLPSGSKYQAEKPSPFDAVTSVSMSLSGFPTRSASRKVRPTASSDERSESTSRLESMTKKNMIDAVMNPTAANPAASQSRIPMWRRRRRGGRVLIPRGSLEQNADTGSQGGKNPGSDRIESVKTLVFIPAWNEADSIRSVIEDAREHVPGAHVLVIDDGSGRRNRGPRP